MTGKNESVYFLNRKAIIVPLYLACPIWLTSGEMPPDLFQELDAPSWFVLLQ